MQKIRIPVSLIALAVAAAISALSWHVYGSGLALEPFSNAAKAFVSPANVAISSWNDFALENGITVVVQTSISLDGQSDASQAEDLGESVGEGELEDPAEAASEGYGGAL